MDKENRCVHRANRPRQFAGCLLLLSLLQTFFPTHCAAELIHLYNAGRDQAAQQIRSNYANIDVAGIIRLQQTNLDAIASNELAAVKTMAIMQRDAAIFSVIQGTNLSVDFYKRVSDRLDELIAGFSSSITNADDNSHTNIIVTTSHLQFDFDSFNWYSEAFQQTYQMAPPPFQFGASGPPDMGAWFTKHPSPAYAIHPGDATSYAEFYSRLLQDFSVTDESGLLRQATRSLLTAQAKLAQEQKDSDDASQEYNQALTNYNDAVTNAQQKSLTGVPNDVSNALVRVSNALVTVNTSLQRVATNGESFGRLAAITNELAAIDAVINASVSTNAIAENAKIKDPAVREAAAVASTLPGILDKSVSFAKSLNQPSLVGLLIDRDILLVQKDMAQRAIDRETQEVALREQNYVAILDEANLLSDILEKRNAIIKSKGNDALTNSTIGALTSWSKTDTGTKLQGSLLEYAESIRVSQYHSIVAQYQIMDLYYDQANDASEGAAEMWNSLLANPINTLAQYHAGGVTPAQIADILSKFFIGSAILAK